MSTDPIIPSRRREAVLATVTGFPLTLLMVVVGVSMSSKDVDSSTARGAGLFRLLNALIGIDGVHLIFFGMGMLMLWVGIIGLWRLIDRRPLARITRDGIAFHPSVAMRMLHFADITDSRVKPANAQHPNHFKLELRTTVRLFSMSNPLGRHRITLAAPGTIMVPFCQALVDLSPHLP